MALVFISFVMLRPKGTELRALLKGTSSSTTAMYHTIISLSYVKIKPKVYGVWGLIKGTPSSAQFLKKI
jgi:hypothetical protein